MKIRRLIPAWLVAASVVLSMRLLIRTLRMEFHLASQEANPYRLQSERRFVYCVWHDAFFGPMFAGPHPQTVALVSRHQDGTYLARTLKMIGVGTVRGSSSKGATTAVRELLKSTEGQHIIVTPDGPRGPRREMKPGPIFLSSRLGKPIVPVAFSYSRSWRIPAGWSDLRVPKPFCRMYAVTAEPIEIPENASREELDAFTAQLQSEMDRITELAEALARGESVTKDQMTETGPVQRRNAA